MFIGSILISNLVYSAYTTVINVEVLTKYSSLLLMKEHLYQLYYIILNTE